MHTISDAFFWRATFLLAMLAAPLLAFGVWRIAGHPRRRARRVSSERRTLDSPAPRQVRA